ncbi:MAG: RtcB family protein [Elusimicrobia bacterium]|nr:RtcB family protein [Elusimicrobiota bacterium]
METADLRFQKIDDYRWELPRQGAMRVPGRVYASEKMLSKLERERVASQVANVATFPGIVGYSLAMPDAHWGYGFCVGGVAAMDVDAGGVISPGGVGFDISCGVRLLRSGLMAEEVAPRMDGLMDALFHAVPSGVGSKGKLRLSEDQMRRVFKKGARWAVENGLGDAEDLETLEDRGAIEDADPDGPSRRAVERGRDQLGTLGSGNHFLEVQKIDAIYDQPVAEAFGLFEGQLVVLIHTGSRGCGYQICSDSIQEMLRASLKYGIALPDKQLCCAPLKSPEGRAYFGAMGAGANFARANRQVVTHRVREAFMHAMGASPRELDMGVVYDVCHNVAKIEKHEFAGRKLTLCVHRKGATRSFPAGHPELPARYQKAGQPVFLPGSMGTASYVLVGTERAMRETFGTVAHGAGRRLSRTQASKQISGRDLRLQLEKQGIRVRTDSERGLAEEAPFAYKDVSEVVEICDRSGIAKKVARMRPMGVVKG